MAESIRSRDQRRLAEGRFNDRPSDLRRRLDRQSHRRGLSRGSQEKGAREEPRPSHAFSEQPRPQPPRSGLAAVIAVARLAFARNDRGLTVRGHRASGGRAAG